MSQTFDYRSFLFQNDSGVPEQGQRYVPLAKKVHRVMATGSILLALVCILLLLTGILKIHGTPDALIDKLMAILLVLTIMGFCAFWWLVDGKGDQIRDEIEEFVTKYNKVLSILAMEPQAFAALSEKQQRQLAEANLHAHALQTDQLQKTFGLYGPGASRERAEFERSYRVFEEFGLVKGGYGKYFPN